jgi:hypothetical protein
MTKRASMTKMLLVGLTGLVLLAGGFLFLRYLAGSWERLGDWVMGGLLGGLALATIWFLAMLVGSTLWVGSPFESYEGRGGLSKRLDEYKVKRAQAAASKAAAARQDGQVSLPADTQGRVTLTK